MKTWLELEARFRDLAGREPKLTLFAREGDDGVGYQIAYFNSPTTARELEALATRAGQMLAESKVAEKSPIETPNDCERWWRYLKNNSRDVFRGGHGSTRNSQFDEARHNQTGLLRNLALVSANECLLLHSLCRSKDRFRVLKWLHEHYVETIVTALATAALVRWLIG